MIANGIVATGGGLVNNQDLINSLLCNVTLFEPPVPIQYY